MARTYARILTKILTDQDFLALSANAQRFYLLILASPHLSVVGVLPYTERRWANLAPDTTVEDVRAGVAELQAAHFLMVDEAADEVFVRSFVANDAGTLKSPNLLLRMVEDYDAIVSQPIRDAFLWEWHRKLAAQVEPDLSKDSWRVAAEALQKLPQHFPTNPWEDPSGNPSGNPSNKGAEEPFEEPFEEGFSRVRARQPHPQPQPQPQSSLADASQREISQSAEITTDDEPAFALVVAEVERQVQDAFQAFWEAYPRGHRNGKIGGGASRQRTKAVWDRLGSADRREVMIGVAHFAEYHARPDTDEFVPHASTWLNERRWESWQEPATGGRVALPRNVREAMSYDAAVAEYGRAVLLHEQAEAQREAQRYELGEGSHG